MSANGSFPSLKSCKQSHLRNATPVVATPTSTHCSSRLRSSKYHASHHYPYRHCPARNKTLSIPTTKKENQSYPFVLPTHRLVLPSTPPNSTTLSTISKKTRKIRVSLVKTIVRLVVCPRPQAKNKKNKS